MISRQFQVNRVFRVGTLTTPTLLLVVFLVLRPLRRYIERAMTWALLAIVRRQLLSLATLSLICQSTYHLVRWSGRYRAAEVQKHRVRVLAQIARPNAR